MKFKALMYWFGLLVALVTTSPALGQVPVTKVTREVNEKMVKLFGAGGFKGLPSYGTGILVSPTGHILTVNNHILNTVDLRVHLYDGRFYHGKVIAKEPGLDVALIELEEEVEGLAHFDFPKEAAKPIPEVGTWILAFSNQFQIATRDEPMSVMHGTLSSFARLRGRRGVFNAPYRGKVHFLDVVANNPGAAGGIITNRKGDLLGIIGRELKNRLSDTWVNYAVPIQATVKILRDDKTVEVSMKDFVVQGMKGTYREGKRTEVTKKGGGYNGIVLVPNVVSNTPPYVDAVEANSPASKAGLRQDDLIVYVDGELVQSVREFRNLMETYAPGETLRIDVQRRNDETGGALETVNLTLEKLPKLEK